MRERKRGRWREGRGGAEEEKEGGREMKRVRARKTVIKKQEI